MKTKVEAQGGELVLRNEHGDTVIVPRERRKEAMSALLKDDYKAIDSLALQLPKASRYAENGSLIVQKDPGKDLLRPDGTKKGKGFYGNLPNKNGDISSELSISSSDVENGKEVLIPTLIPGLSKTEIDYLLSNKYNPQSREGVDDKISRKAINFAKSRKQQGFPYFAHDIEEGAFKIPKYAAGGTVLDGQDPPTLLKPPPYKPSNVVLDLKGALAGASLIGNAFSPAIGYAAQLLNVGGDLYTGTRHAMAGQYKDAAIDYAQAGIGLIPSSRMIGPGKSGVNTINLRKPRVVNNKYANYLNMALDVSDLSNTPNNYDILNNKYKLKAGGWASGGTVIPEDPIEGMMGPETTITASRLKKDPDSLSENILEWIDPTGISSYDDVSRSFKDPNSTFLDKTLNIASALPFMGKLAKFTKPGMKALEGVKHLGQVEEFVKNLARIGGSIIKMAPSTTNTVKRIYQPVEDLYLNNKHIQKYDNFTKNLHPLRKRNNRDLDMRDLNTIDRLRRGGRFSFNILDGINEITKKE